MLQRHLNATPGVTLIIPPNCSNPGGRIDAFLTAFEFTSDKLSWINESIELPEHELWRQDDNGNEAMIEKTKCRATV
ncbi:hypothetical protein BH11CYA1_BH11CYA1_50590 [soil metagenome]